MTLPYYPKEVIEKAKEMDLLTYLQTMNLMSLFTFQVIPIALKNTTV